MLLTTSRSARRAAARRSGFTLLEILVVVAIIVILAGVAVVAVPRYLEDGRKTAAMSGCKNIDTAIKAYTANPANPSGVFSGNLADLYQVPFGGTSYLANGQSDLNDPWGNQYQVEQRQRPHDGTEYWLVYTRARDGTDISQFGIGPLAQPKQ